MTERLVGVLDKCKISDRNAVHIIAAVADALNVDIKDLSLSRSMIQRAR